MLLNTTKNDIHNILLIVPNVQLVKQFISDMTEYGLAEYWNLVNFSSDQDKKNKKKKIDFEFSDKNIIISNSQWLMLHGDTLPYIDCIIQDEIHVCKKGSELSKRIFSSSFALQETNKTIININKYFNFIKLSLFTFFYIF